MRVRISRPNTDWDEAPAKNVMRVGHLFEMTSGLDYDLSTPEIKALREKTGDQFTTRELAAAIAKKPLRFEPGTHWMYGLSHDVLGALIEAVSGMTLGEYCRRAIFDPLGMKETWFHAPESEQSRRCQLYTRDQDGRLQRGETVNYLQLSQKSGKRRRGADHDCGRLCALCLHDDQPRRFAGGRKNSLRPHGRHDADEPAG